MSKFRFSQKVWWFVQITIRFGIRKHNIQWCNCTFDMTHGTLPAKKTKYDFDPLQAKFKEIQHPPCEVFPFILPFLFTSVIEALTTKNPCSCGPRKHISAHSILKNLLRSTFQWDDSLVRMVVELVLTAIGALFLSFSGSWAIHMNALLPRPTSCNRISRLGGYPRWLP